MSGQLDTLTVTPGAGEPVDIDLHTDAAADPWAVIALAHGAGTTAQHPAMAALGRAIADAGITAVRFNFPYSQLGRRMPGPASHSIATWVHVADWLAQTHPELPRVAAGRSYGGRMASMAAAEGNLDATALIYFGYPLHPPGKPESPRTAHLEAVRQPQLFLSGTNDPFVQPTSQLDTAVAQCRDATLEWVPGAGHSFEVKGARRAPEEIAADLVTRATQWLRPRL